MHLDLAAWLNLVSTLAIVGALIFTGLQVRAANMARRDQAALELIRTSLSENSARVLELLTRIPENAPATVIAGLPAEEQSQIVEYGIRFEVTGYMVFRGLLDLKTVDDLAGGAILAYWNRARAWAEKRRSEAGYHEFLEWCEWVAARLSERRATRAYVPAYKQHAAWRE